MNDTLRQALYAIGANLDPSNEQTPIVGAIRKFNRERLGAPDTSGLTPKQKINAALNRYGEVFMGAHGANGKKVAYHGTPHNIVGDLRPSKDGLMGEGFYLAPNRRIAEMFGREVYDTEVGGRVENKDITPNIFEFDTSGLKMKELSDKGDFYNAVESLFGDISEKSIRAFQQKLIEQGFDGIDLINRGESVAFTGSLPKLKMLTSGK